VRWKINVDGSAIPGLERGHPSDDALSAFIVYSLVAAAGGDIKNEVADMQQAAAQYVRRGMRASTDPLGWGLLAWKSQVCGWA
jgi:hypothetical protein